MAEELGILEYVVLAGFLLIILILVIYVGYLVIRYFLDRKNNPDYLEKNYVDFIEFSRNNVPESIEDYTISIASNKLAEGRPLGKIKGYAYYNMKMQDVKNISKLKTEGEEKPEEKTEENVKEKQEPEELRHLITYLPRKNEFNFLDPSTWTKKYRVAIIKNSELPEGLNGNIKWVTDGIEFYKYFVFPIEDQEVDKVKLHKRMESDIMLSAGLESYRNLSSLVKEASELDSSMGKSIRKMTEAEARKR